jgi:hypothetical protein
MFGKRYRPDPLEAKPQTFIGWPRNSPPAGTPRQLVTQGDRLHPFYQNFF